MEETSSCLRTAFPRQARQADVKMQGRDAGLTETCSSRGEKWSRSGLEMLAFKGTGSEGKELGEHKHGRLRRWGEHSPFALWKDRIWAGGALTAHVNFSWVLLGKDCLLNHLTRSAYWINALECQGFVFSKILRIKDFYLECQEEIGKQQS